MSKEDRKIYLVSSKIDDMTVYKIGYTARSVETRIKEFKTGNCSEFEIIHIYEPLDFPVTIETSLHKHFYDKKINGEWFSLTEQDVESFLGKCEEIYERFKMLSNMNTYIDDMNIKFK
jgi:hypothetical protein